MRHCLPACCVRAGPLLTRSGSLCVLPETVLHFWMQCCLSCFDAFQLMQPKQSSAAVRSVRFHSRERPRRSVPASVMSTPALLPGLLLSPNSLRVCGVPITQSCADIVTTKLPFQKAHQCMFEPRRLHCQS